MHTTPNKLVLSQALGPNRNAPRIRPSPHRLLPRAKVYIPFQVECAQQQYPLPGWQFKRAKVISFYRPIPFAMNLFILIGLVVSAAAAAADSPQPSLPYTAPLGYRVVDADGLVPIKSHNASANALSQHRNCSLHMFSVLLQAHCTPSPPTTATRRTSSCSTSRAAATTSRCEYTCFLSALPPLSPPFPP